MTKQYLFGDTALAARRLEVLAGAFAPTSKAFLSEAARPKVKLAADLGCGPGYTTHMLADALECERVLGLDNSEQFIRLAARTATNKVSFRLQDVTNAPFPFGPFNLIYARFLLTHQRNPEKLITQWATQLSPDGRLLLEEVEAIDAPAEPFAEYLKIVEAMLADAGHNLNIGPKLDAIASPAGLVRLSSRIARPVVTNDLAAKMFSMNIQTWKQNAFVQKNYSPEMIGKLQDELTDLAAKPTNETDIQWRLRQIAYEREK